MTKEDLQKMGIIHLESKLYPNKFFVPQVGEVNLYEPYRWEDIFQTICSTKHKSKIVVQMIKLILLPTFCKARVCFIFVGGKSKFEYLYIN